MYVKNYDGICVIDMVKVVGNFIVEIMFLVVGIVMFCVVFLCVFFMCLIEDINF